jgi:anti-sigma-K factor RskA
VSDLHLDDELLAGIALGDEDATPRQTHHLDGCPSCAANLAELRQLRDQVAEGAPGEILAPAPGLLGRIHAELLDEPVPEPAAQGTIASPSAARRPARWRSLVAVAAALGLVVGAGGTVALERLRAPTTQLLASTQLQALPGWTGGGNAELVHDGSIDQLRVRVSAPNPSDAFRELWLINTDGRRMISLGVLDASGQGSYPLPPVLTGNLQGYVLVDVSAEPFDGNSAHSRNSIVRGQLP